jgi:hypothetical protein
MKRSDVLYRVLFVMFAALLIAVFVIPQATLNHYELVFLGIIMPIMGWMWIQAYVDAEKGN